MKTDNSNLNSQPQETSQGLPIEQRIDRLISFNKFWGLYGRKDKKFVARSKWMKLKDDEISKIFETLPAFLKANPDIKFRPMPSTYLHQRRWEDDIEVEVKPELPSWATPNDYR